MITTTVKMTFTNDVLGTASGNPDIHKEYISSNAPDAATMKEEIEAIGTEGVFEKSMTVFPRNKKGEPIVYDYQLRGMLKESMKFVRKISPSTACAKIKAYKQEVDGMIFVYPRQIPIQLPEDGEVTILQRSLRASTAQGERIALASSERVPAGSSITFDIEMLADSDEDAVIEALDYGCRHGFGQWRNSGCGTFTYKILDRKVSKDWRN